MPGFHLPFTARTKKADVAEHPKVLDHVGLLCNEPSGKAGLLFIQSSDDFCSWYSLTWGMQ
jgi:hypothetical protein